MGSAGYEYVLSTSPLSLTVIDISTGTVVNFANVVSALSVMSDSSCAQSGTKYTALTLSGGALTASIVLSCGAVPAPAFVGNVSGMEGVLALQLTIPCVSNPGGVNSLCVATNTAVADSGMLGTLLADVFGQISTVTLPTGLSMELLFGGRRDALCNINVAIGVLIPGASTSDSQLWITSPGSSVSWFLPAVPSGWQLYASLSGSQRLAGSALLEASMTRYISGISLSDPQQLMTSSSGALNDISISPGSVSSVAPAASASWDLLCGASLTCPSTLTVVVTLAATTNVGAVVLQFSSANSIAAAITVFSAPLADSPAMLGSVTTPYVQIDASGAATVVVQLTGSDNVARLRLELAPLVPGGSPVLLALGLIPPPSSTATVSLVAPATNNCNVQLPDPTLAVAYSPWVTRTSSSISWSPALVAITLPPSPILIGSTIHYTENGVPVAELYGPANGDALGAQFRADGLLVNSTGLTLYAPVVACGGAGKIVRAWLTKPGMPASLIASSFVSAASGCTSSIPLTGGMLEAVVAGSTIGTPYIAVIPGLAVALGGSGTGRSDTCSVLITIATGSILPGALNSPTIELVRVDSGADNVVLAVVLPRLAATTLDLGILGGTPQLQGQPHLVLRASYPNGAHIDSPVLAIPPCTGVPYTCDASTSLSNYYSGLLCLGVPLIDARFPGSACTLQFQQCWVESMSPWIQYTPASTACLNGIFVSLASPACIAPTPTPVPQVFAAVDTTCNAFTWLACAVGAGEAAERNAAPPSAPVSACSVSYTECWAGYSGVVRQTPSGTGCLRGVFVNLESPQCAPTVVGSRVMQHIATAVGLPAASTNVPTVIDIGGSSQCSALGVLCSSQCGAAVRWCSDSSDPGQYVSTLAPTPVGTLCYTDNTTGTIAFVSESDERCSPAMGTCDGIADNTPFCYSQELGGVVNGTCSDSYVMCLANSRGTAPIAVPLGTLCYNGLIVLATDEACLVGTIWDDSDLLVANVTVLARGLPRYAGPQELGAITSAIARSLSAAGVWEPFSITIAAADLENTAFAEFAAIRAVNTALAPPLPGIQIIESNSIASPSVIGATHIYVVVNALTSIDAVYDALRAAVSLDSGTGLSPATAFLALAGSSVTLELVSGSTNVAPSPTIAPSVPAASPNRLSLALILSIAFASALCLVAVLIARAAAVRAAMKRARQKKAVAIATAAAAAAAQRSPFAAAESFDFNLESARGANAETSSTENDVDLMTDTVEVVQRNKRFFVPLASRPVGDVVVESRAVTTAEIATVDAARSATANAGAAAVDLMVDEVYPARLSIPTHWQPPADFFPGDDDSVII